MALCEGRCSQYISISSPLLSVINLIVSTSLGYISALCFGERLGWVWRFQRLDIRTFWLRGKYFRSTHDSPTRECQDNFTLTTEIPFPPATRIWLSEDYPLDGPCLNPSTCSDIRSGIKSPFMFDYVLLLFIFCFLFLVRWISLLIFLSRGRRLRFDSSCYRLIVIVYYFYIANNYYCGIHSKRNRTGIWRQHLTL